ncbi:MAG: BatA and WFA domain-containing protein, partial [Planctomycetes bacterium]|nr:BatA and WFA domain-containing protein [Planctomycetota bacterium]
MNFLTPQFIAIAAALTVPPLVALYFLKLRRQEVAISSTFFWKRAVQDLQVNAPFQKLRRNLLMFLQLLVLLLAALALGQPLLRKEQTSRKSLILLMDRSASMNVVEPDGKTRLERAKQAAIQQIEQVGSEFDRAMVIAFSDRAKMMTAFTSNRNILEDAIDRITPSDGLSSLREAVALAEAHSELQIVEAEGITATPVPTGPPAQAVLFSDGRIADAVDLTLQRMSMKIVRDIAVSSDNVGIVSLTASRNYQRPEILSVVAGIQNFGPSGVEFDVQVFIE